MTPQKDRQVVEGRTSYGGKQWGSKPINAEDFMNRVCMDCQLRYFRNDEKVLPVITYADVEGAMMADYKERRATYGQALASGKKATSPKTPKEADISKVFQDLSRKQSKQRLESCKECAAFCKQFFKDDKVQLKEPFLII